jgi:hypothetical protein
MNRQDEPAKAMEETAKSLRHQDDILRKQAGELIKEARRIRGASRTTKKLRSNSK